MSLFLFSLSPFHSPILVTFCLPALATSCPYTLCPTALAPSYPVLFLPSHPCTLSPSHLCALVPSHPCTLMPLHPFVLLPLCPPTCHPCTLLPLHPPTLAPFPQTLLQTCLQTLPWPSAYTSVAPRSSHPMRHLVKLSLPAIQSTERMRVCQSSPAIFSKNLLRPRDMTAPIFLWLC